MSKFQLLKRKFINYQKIIHYFGVSAAFSYLSIKIFLTVRSLLNSALNRRLIYTNEKGINYPFATRINTSDESVYTQVFVEKEYESLLHIKNPKIIIDCGSYIGLSSIWFLTHFLNSKIIALEPDKQNYLLCKRNLQPYLDRATLLNKALWSDSKGVQLHRGTFRDGKDWAVQTKKEIDKDSKFIESIDMQGLIKKYNLSSIDILKIDIEGAEKEVFSSKNMNWLNIVKNIVIEIHSKECEKKFFSTLKNFTFITYCYGDLRFCTNIKNAK